ncbi:MAG TPA: hypothetical protein VFP02_09165 [Acidimicrobiales bacterium]|nr:hypothetical protein [Acidimicrobiales bacterium]
MFGRVRLRTCTAAACGRGRHRVNGPFRFAYNDLFTFADGRIRRVDSYVVSLL